MTIRDMDIFENPECVHAIYKDDIPSFMNVEISRLTILPGEKTELILTIDTHELPSVLPDKWLSKHVNTIQFEIDFIDVKFDEFNFSNGPAYSLEISSSDRNKVCILRNLSSSKELKLIAKWVYVRDIICYEQE